jgi:alkylated DNA nucleotide flippase Atl1
MKYCPICLEEYEDTATSCAECHGERLLSEQEVSSRPELRRVRQDEDIQSFVLASTAEDLFEADAFTAAVHEAGIPVLARMRRSSAMEALTESTQRPWWDIMVPEPKREEAARIMEECRQQMADSEDEAVKAAEEEELETEEHR